MNPFIQTKKTDKQTSLIVDRIRSLISSLQNANRAYKIIAGRCSDRKAQILVFGLATEAFQFYKELSLYAQLLRGETSFNENIFTDYKYDHDDFEDEPQQHMDKVLKDCGHVEHSLIGDFKRLLNDHVIAGDLRKMLQEQLNGLLYSSAKIKMLDSLHVSPNNFVRIW